MYKRVIVEEGQGVSEVDFARLGTFPQDGIDAATRDLLYASSVYSGFTATVVNSVTVQLAAGRLRQDGRTYASETVQERSVAEYVPVTAGLSVVCLVIGQGQEVSDATENRYYERPVNPENPDAGTQQTVEDAYRIKNRKVTLTVIPGTEAARPVAPVAPVGSVAIAEILITPSGIQSVAMRANTRARTVESLAMEIDLQKAVNAEQGQAIDGLRADLAGVRAQLLNTASRGTLTSLQVDMALMKDRLDVPDDGSPYWADRFLDYDETDYDPVTATGHVDFDALIMEGIRANYEAETTFPLSLLAPNDPNLMHVADGRICPKYADVPGIVVDAEAGEMPLGGVSVQNVTVEKLTESRQRIRYGSSMTICTNQQFWRSGNYDPISEIFTASSGETYKVSTAGTGGHTNPNGWDIWTNVRLTRMWIDTITVPYDKFKVDEETIAGVVKAESWLQHQERWVTGLDLAIKRWGAGAEVTVALCECRPDGTPDTTRTIGTITKSSADFATWPSWTSFTFDTPRFTAPLADGEGRARAYAWVFFTTGDVDVVIADGQDFLGGNLFVTTDGIYYDGDLTRDICHRTRYARFAVTQMPVRLGSWNLSGGIEDIDVLAPMIVPASSHAIFEVLVGGTWRPIAPSEADASFLNGVTALYEARVVLTGTSWAMPIITMTGSRVRLARPKDEFTWISAPWNAGETMSEVKVRAVVGAWDPARHTLVASLLRGAGYATSVAAVGAPTIRTVPGREVSTPTQETAVEMEWTFDTSGSPVQNLKLKMVGGTNNYRIPFHVEWIVARKTD